MGFDFAGVRDKVVVGTLTAIVLGGLALFGNWASQGGLVHALRGVTAKDLEEAIQKLEIEKLDSQIKSLKTAQETLNQKINVLTTAAKPSQPPETLLVKEVRFDPPPPVANLEILLRDLIKKRCDGTGSCDFDIASTTIGSQFPDLQKVAVMYWCSNRTAPFTEYGSKSAVLILKCIQ